uniref:Uncharacterized protein n=1 Tax=Oryza brachyantha TaxID=4533 RepID=J3MLW6_ORYBR
MASPASGAAGAGDDDNAGRRPSSSLIDPLLVSRTSSIGGAERNAAKGKHWAAADKAERRAAKESGGEDGRPLKLKGLSFPSLEDTESPKFIIILLSKINYSI